MIKNCHGCTFNRPDMSWSYCYINSKTNTNYMLPDSGKPNWCPMNKKSDWFYIVDRMPNVHADGRWRSSDPILVYSRDKDRVIAVYQETWNEGRWINYETGGFIYDVIAWMPLPKAPDVEDGENGL